MSAAVGSAMVKDGSGDENNGSLIVCERGTEIKYVMERLQNCLSLRHVPTTTLQIISDYLPPFVTSMKMIYDLYLKNPLQYLILQCDVGPFHISIDTCVVLNKMKNRETAKTTTEEVGFSLAIKLASDKTSEQINKYLNAKSGSELFVNICPLLDAKEWDAVSSRDKENLCKLLSPAYTPLTIVGKSSFNSHDRMFVTRCDIDIADSLESKMRLHCLENTGYDFDLDHARTTTTTTNDRSSGSGTYSNYLLPTLNAKYLLTWCNTFPNVKFYSPATTPDTPDTPRLAEIITANRLFEKQIIPKLLDIVEEEILSNNEHSVSARKIQNNRLLKNMLTDKKKWPVHPIISHTKLINLSWDFTTVGVFGYNEDTLLLPLCLVAAASAKLQYDDTKPKAKAEIYSKLYYWSKKVMRYAAAAATTRNSGDSSDFGDNELVGKNFDYLRRLLDRVEASIDNEKLPKYRRLSPEERDFVCVCLLHELNKRWRYSSLAK